MRQATIARGQSTFLYLLSESAFSVTVYAKRWHNLTRKDLLQIERSDSELSERTVSLVLVYFE